MNPGQTQRFVSRLTRDTLALILAGGRGSRLKHLTCGAPSLRCLSVANSASSISPCPIA